MTPHPDYERGFLAWFAKNKVAANLLMFFFLFDGWKVATTMQVQTFPTIVPGIISVSVSYPGATPSEVEDSITRRVEEAVRGIDGVDRIRSSAVEGLATINIELASFVDELEIRDDIQTAVDQLAQFPPESAERPRITISESVSSVLRLVVSGSVDEAGLRQAAERIQGDLLDLPDVGQVILQGARAYEIAIEVSEDTLREYELSLSDVASAVDTSSINLSAGVLRTDGGDILLRTDAERKTGVAFEDVIVRSDTTGQQLLLRDIATVIDGFEDEQLINTFNGEPALFLQVVKGDAQDAFEVGNAIKSYLATYTPPAGIEIAITADETTVIQQRMNLLIRNGILGLSLVFIFLTLTLDLKLAFWTSLAIPVSFLGGFLFFGQFLTINMVTLFALIGVLGIVVDDAIVVGENIYVEQQRGKRGVTAAMAGLRGVMAPVTIGVLTTMAAFLPLTLSTGTLGQILAPFPVVVVAVLFVSLVEAYLILPSHLSHEGEWSVGAMRRFKLTVQRGLETFRDKYLLPVIDLATHFRYLTIWISLMILLVVVVGLIGSGRLGFVFFPLIESDEISVNLSMPEGTPFEITESAMEQIVLGGYEVVGGPESELLESMTVTTGGTLQQGGGPGSGSGGTSIASHRGQVRMMLVSSEERNVSAFEVQRQWRQIVGDIPGAESLTFSASTLSGGSDVSVDMFHVDNEKLEQSVVKVQQALAEIQGVDEIESSADIGKRQLDFELTSAGAAAGLTTQELSRQIRQAFFGQEVQRIQRVREEIRVYVRYPESERQSLSDLSRMRIRLPSGEEADLAVVADWTESRSYSSIDRVDGRRVLTVSAAVDEDVITPNEVNSILQREVLPALAAQDPDLFYTFEGQAREQAEDLSSLASNLGIAIVLMYIMLASVLRSYIQPIVILMAIPFGVVGSAIGHLIMGFDLSFLSLFGLVALSGVIVNDSVVLIDMYNKLKAQGYSTHKACVAASRRRFRPILLTTLTTFLGLLPMITETSIQAQFLIPMAISLAFGILFGSIMIVLLVPALLHVLEDMRHIKGTLLRLRDKLFAKIQARNA